MELFVDWFENPLTKIWIFDAFWINRIAIFLQFIAGSIIIIDIVGIRQIEKWIISFKEGLGEIEERDSIGSLFKYTWNKIKSFFGERKRIKFNTMPLIVTNIIALVLGLILLGLFLHKFNFQLEFLVISVAVIKIICLIILAYFISRLIVFLFILDQILYVLITIFLILFLKFLNNIIFNERFIWRTRVFSFILFLVGSFFNLLAS